MPDEFEGLIAELGGEESSPEVPEIPEDGAADDDQAPETHEDEGAPENDEAPEGVDGAKGASQDDPQGTPSLEDDKANRAFAEMRVKNKQYEKALSRAAEIEGVTIEEYLKSIEDDSLKKKAEQMGTDPELLRRLEQLEAENESFRMAQVELHLQREFGRVQKELKVTDKELQAFTSELVKRGHNFHDAGVDYVLMYRGMFHDQLVEKARQDWIARSDKGNAGGTVITKKGKGDSDQATITTMEALEKLLDEIED